MKRFQSLLLAASLALLGACSGTGTGGGSMNASEYLTENVAFWNGTTSTVQQWTVGPRGEELREALQSGQGLSTFKPGLGKAQQEIRQHLMLIDQMPPADDDKVLHQKLRTYVQSCEEMFTVLGKMAALPDGYSREQIAPLAEQLQQIGNRIDAEMQALSQAQAAYAKQHRINLQQQ